MTSAIILSGGILPDKTLDERTLARVDRGIELLANGAADRLIMAGGHGAIITFDANRHYTIHGHSLPPEYPTQGAAMAAYALQRGVPSDKLLLQDVSRDTVGEVLFTGLQYLAPNQWRKNFLIANVSQMTRALFLHGRILGLQYEAIPVTTYHPSDEQPSVVAKESQSLETFLAQFGDISRGDLSAFQNRLYERHGLYKHIVPEDRPKFPVTN